MTPRQAQAVVAAMHDRARPQAVTAAGQAVLAAIESHDLTFGELCLLFGDLLAGALVSGPPNGRDLVAARLIGEQIALREAAGALFVRPAGRA